MSECTLHVLDAPRIKSQEAALDFVAKWADHDERKPSVRIEAFLQELLQIYPDAASVDDNIWYESVAQNASDGPVLALYFELALFDADALKTLRAVARKHKLHLFDEEGYVLYLANGKEVGRSAVDPLAALKGATHSLQGLRFDGVYIAKLNVGWSYYRFTADGKVFRQSVAVQMTAARAFSEMVEGDPFVGHGKYVIDEHGVAGKVKQTNGVFQITARIDGDTLSIASVRKDGEYPHTAVYAFAAL